MDTKAIAEKVENMIPEGWTLHQLNLLGEKATDYPEDADDIIVVYNDKYDRFIYTDVWGDGDKRHFRFDVREKSTDDNVPVDTGRPDVFGHYDTTITEALDTLNRIIEIIEGDKNG